MGLPEGVSRDVMTAESASTDTEERSRRKGARAVLLGFLALGVLAWIGIAIAGIVKDASLGGILGGLFGGFFMGLLVAGAGAWAAMSFAFPRPKPNAESIAEGDALQAQLSGLLAELETVRLETVRQINQRASWRVPLCAAGGLAFWIFGQFSDDPGDILDLAILMGMAGVGGYVWASLALSNQYSRLYKGKVLPKLAAAFGDITYRHAVMPDLALMRAERIFREFKDAKAEDELVGTHRGCPTSIVELKLEIGSGKSRRTVFDGLLVEIELPRDTHATTAVINDGGAFGNLRDRMLAAGRQRVALEDPVFERVYEVYGTDQVAARALLNPAFMEKLLQLADRPDFGRPLALCVGKRLVMAMPKRGGKDLFEAPSFRQPASSREALVQLRRDIAAVLAAADAVIDLDHRFTVAPLR